MNEKLEQDMSKEINTGDMIDMIGSRFEMVARVGACDGDTVLFRTRMDPGKLVPLHSHMDPECFYVLEGQIEVFLVDDTPKWHTVEAGRSMLVADGIKDAVRNSTEMVADIVLVTNNRFASFVAEAGRLTVDELFSPPSPQDIQRMLQVSQAYGYWNASPAESEAFTG
jgi:quercetin dioxygenase-like cupin family protein